MDTILVGLVAFAAMEPITAATHRVVMHGPGWFLHRSHHVPSGPGASSTGMRSARWEANDVYPVLFAGIVCVGLAIGFNVGGAGVLVPVGLGVTAYGAAYGFVHDIVIHRRLGRRPTVPTGLLGRLVAAHAIHHRHGGAPYGMLVPVVPRAYRHELRADATGDEGASAPTVRSPAA